MLFNPVSVAQQAPHAGASARPARMREHAKRAACATGAARPGPDPGPKGLPESQAHLHVPLEPNVTVEDQP